MAHLPSRQTPTQGSGWGSAGIAPMEPYMETRTESSGDEGQDSTDESDQDSPNAPLGTRRIDLMLLGKESRIRLSGIRVHERTTFGDIRGHLKKDSDGITLTYLVALRPIYGPRTYWTEADLDYPIGETCQILYFVDTCRVARYTLATVRTAVSDYPVAIFDSPDDIPVTISQAITATDPTLAKELKYVYSHSGDRDVFNDGYQYDLLKKTESSSFPTVLFIVISEPPGKLLTDSSESTIPPFLQLPLLHSKRLMETAYELQKFPLQMIHLSKAISHTVISLANGLCPALNSNGNGDIETIVSQRLLEIASPLVRNLRKLLAEMEKVIRDIQGGVVGKARLQAAVDQIFTDLCAENPGAQTIRHSHVFFKNLAHIDYGGKPWAVMGGSEDLGAEISQNQTSSTGHSAVPSPSGDAQWGNKFWVTLSDPQTGAELYACPATGECSWEPPVGSFVLLPNDEGQWWELSDDTRNNLLYYYHTVTGETRWEKPGDAFVIPLQGIQTTSLGRRLSMNVMEKRNSQTMPGPSIPDSIPEQGERSRNSSEPNESRRAATEGSVPVRFNHSGSASTPISSANVNAKGRQTPPSLSRLQQRASGAPYIISSQPQNLDAVAEMVLRNTPRSASTSAAAGQGGMGGWLGGRPPMEPSRSAPNFRQEYNRGGKEEFTAELRDSARRANGNVGGVPPKLKVVTDSNSMKLGGLSQQLSRSAVDSRGIGVTPSRRQAPPLPDKARLWRNTTTTAQISSPMANPSARSMPLAAVGNGPIMITNYSQMHTKRLRAGYSDHRTLPKNLVQEIQQFQVADFAKRYFNTHRTGLLFRRRVPVEQLMSWQKAPLTSPLLVLNRSLHRDAVKIFKIIQRIMGDRQLERSGGVLRIHGDTSGRESGRESEAGHQRSSGTSIIEEEQWLLSEGLSHGELRDEIYCQVVKQLSGNPSPESIFRGWQLLCVLVVTFPPSINFEDYLRSFMREQSQQTEDKIDVMSRYCIGKLRVVAKKGPRSKAPSTQEIEVAQDAAFNPPTFGESLSSVYQLQQRTYPSAKIPIILPFLADGILALGGMKSEGIFRAPGESALVADLRLRIDRGFYNLENIDDPHVPASLFKLWLRELQDPLIPDDLYNECISCAEDEDPQKVMWMVSMLPTINRHVVLFVISFLQQFLDERVMRITKMTAVNLAVIFAPNLLRCNSDSMSVVFINAKYEQSFVHNLLLHCNCKMDPDYVPSHGLGPQ